MYFAVAAVVLVTVIIKKTVVGRRFEAVGAGRPPLGRPGCARSARHGRLRVGDGAVLAGRGPHRRDRRPAHRVQGDAYLLSSVAAVVLGGTSRLGVGAIRWPPLAALFLVQLGQFVLALGVTTAIRTLVEAAALAVGVALHTINWSAVRARFSREGEPGRHCGVMTRAPA